MRLKVFEDDYGDILNLKKGITESLIKLEEHEDRIQVLEKTALLDAYGREDVDSYMISWRVEEIAHVFNIPTNAMFDEAGMDEIKTGDMHFLLADINEPHDNHFPENTMRRYTMNAYCASPKEVTYRIQYADRCVVLLDDVVQATYTDLNGNFYGTSKILVLSLKEGWSKIQFLVANRTQQGGLQVKSNLFEQTNYLSNMTQITGYVSGKKIKPGSIEGYHISPNMDLVVRTARTTLTDEPSLFVGDEDTNGSLQIADGILYKSANEPFRFLDDIRVYGTIYGERVRLDEPAVMVVSDSEPELISTLVRSSKDGDVFHLKLDLSNYVTREEFEKLKDLINSMVRVKPIITKFICVERTIEKPTITMFRVVGPTITRFVVTKMDY